jgi:hypothetical protein
MPVTISGSGTITGIATGGLPDGSIAAGDLASSLDLTGKTVTLPAGTGGKILQVVQGFTDTQVTVTTATYTDSGLSANITPASTSSKILVIANQQAKFYRAGHSYAGFRILRDSTTIIESVFDGNGPLDFGVDAGTAGTHVRTRATYTYLDSPSSTSQLTYKIQGRPHVANQSASLQMNESGAANNAESYIILMEVAG